MEYISAKIPLLAADLAAKITAYGGNVPREQLITWMHDYWQNTKTRPVELSFIRPDYESIRQQLQSILAESDSWKDLITAGVGETILQMVASTAAYSQLSIQRALQESYLDSARLTSSILSITRMLGVHINRKISAQVEIEITTSDNSFIFIPQYSKFDINGVKFFNTQSIIVNPGQTAKAELYQGDIKIDSFVSNGRSFQRFEIGSSNYNVSDNHIVCFTDTYEKYTRNINTIWSFKGNEFVFYENTTPNGNVELIFGNNLYGKIPPAGQIINVIYAETIGYEANTTLIDQNVKLIELNDVVPDRIRKESSQAEAIERQRIINVFSGVTTSTIYGGDNEKDKEFFRIVAPHLYAANKRAVRREDYWAIGLTYPGVVDIYFQGQKQLGPKSKNYINKIGVTPLMRNGQQMDNANWNKFVEFMDEYGIWQMEYIHIPPKRVNFDLSGTIYCQPGTDIPKVKTYVDYRLAELYSPRLGSLGYSLAISDLYDILEVKHHNLQADYVDIHSPKANIMIDKTSYMGIGSIDISVAFTNRSSVDNVKNN
jgi:hypothetical protein